MSKRERVCGKERKNVFKREKVGVVQGILWPNKPSILNIIKIINLKVMSLKLH